jgi:hypothetical protein
LGQSIAAEKRGALRMPSQPYLDLRVEKEFRLFGNARLKFLIDVWNVFNTDYHYWVAETIGDSEAYLAPSDWVRPRRAQLGVRFVF